MAERFNPDLVRRTGGNGAVGGGNGNTNPPPPSTPPIPPPGRYLLTFDGFTANQIRSAENDTDYASAAAQVNNDHPFTAAVKVGDIGKGGTAATSLVLGPLDVGPNDSLKFTYTIANNGHDSTGNVLQGITTASVQLLGRLFGVGEVAIDVTNAILTGGLSILFADCDGTVAADSIVFSGGQLAELTAQTGEHFEQKEHPGTDSPWGCGDNSRYTTFWHVKRVPAPFTGVITGIAVQPVATQ